MGTLTEDDLRALYRYLRLTRTVEERLERMVKQGQVVGNLYRSLGEEATAVGSAYALEDGDWLCPAIRDLGALFVRGLPPREMFLQYTGRGGGGTGGKDTTTHFTLPELGLLGPVSPLGDQLCVLNGIALAFRKREEPRVCMAFLSEGATRAGASHEGINFAAVQELPMVIVVHHNRYAFSTPSELEGALDDWSDMAGNYGLPVHHVDGNDVLEVYDAASEAVARARAGDGAGMIVAETYRRRGHAQHDPQPYVDPEEMEAWRQRDPLDRFESFLVEEQVCSGDELEVLQEEIRERVEEEAEAALRESRPRGESARTRVYGDPPMSTRGAGATPEAAIPWTRRDVVGYPDLPTGVEGASPGESGREGNRG